MNGVGEVEVDMPMLMIADNPVIRIVKAVVLVAKNLVSKVPLVLINVPLGLVGSDIVKLGSPLLLMLICCRWECCCGFRCD